MDIHTLSPESYPYPTIRSGGLLVSLLGLTMILASLLGGANMVHPGVFFFGLMLACMLSFGVFWRHLLLGEPSIVQSRASRNALILQVVLLLSVWLLLGQGDPRVLWLTVLLVVGVHFLAFQPVHGPITIMLGVLCMVNALAGLVLVDVPFGVFGVIDGVLKLVVGLLMLATRPQTVHSKEATNL